MYSKTVQGFEGNLAKIATDIQSKIVSALRGGYLEKDTSLQFLAEFYPELERILNESGYTDLVMDLHSKAPELINDLRELHSINKVPLRFIKSDTNVLTSLQQMQTTQFAHIGEQAMMAVHNGIMQSALAGTPFSEVIKQIAESLDSKFVKYAATYANTARQEFLQRAEYLSAENTRDEGEALFWEYVGAEDNKNREACIIGLAQRYFTDEERIDFEAMHADERAYNCRHEFMQITERSFNEKSEVESGLSDEEIARRQEILERI